MDNWEEYFESDVEAEHNYRSEEAWASRLSEFNSIAQEKEDVLAVPYCEAYHTVYIDKMYWDPALRLFVMYMYCQDCQKRNKEVLGA